MCQWYKETVCSLFESSTYLCRRKRSEKGEKVEHRETPGAVIVRQATIERVEELRALVKEEQERYR